MDVPLFQIALLYIYINICVCVCLGMFFSPSLPAAAGLSLHPRISVIGKIFTVIFFVELVLRLLAQGRFFCSMTLGWNMLSSLAWLF